MSAFNNRELKSLTQKTFGLEFPSTNVFFNLKVNIKETAF